MKISYRPNPQVVNLLLQASRTLTAEIQIPLMQRCRDLPQSEWQQKVLGFAQEAVAERLIGLLGTLSLSRSCLDPETTLMLVTPVSGWHFAPSVERGLSSRLGLSRANKQYGQAMNGLASDFYDWAKEAELPENALFRFTTTPGKELVMTCVPLKPFRNPPPNECL
jgi:hypothetical protein